MSREVIIKIRDDLDGSDAVETVTFGYRGTDYEIDLSEHNVELFEKTMHQFLEVARKAEAKAKASASPQRKPVDAATKQQRKEIRDWANANGLQVDARGMIANAVVEAFQAANPWVEILPDTPARYVSRKKDSAPAASRVSAQDAEEGLISAASLLTKHYDPTARDPQGRPLDKAQRTKIRRWAQKNGLEQADTGHIRTEVLDAYYEAHPREGR